MLAEICKQRNVFLVYVSTDYVFDGKKAATLMYEPDDEPNPLNEYGKSKLLGEKAIQSVFSNACENGRGYVILRIPVLYGEGNGSESAVNCLVDTVKQANQAGATKVDVDDAQGRYPTCVQDVARTLTDMCQLSLIGDGQGAPWPMRSIYHFGATENLTKYQMCGA
jgi:S-adenosylmethionine synthetase